MDKCVRDDQILTAVHRPPRAILEIITIVLTAVFFGLEISDYRNAKKINTPMLTHFKSHALSLLGLATIVALTIMRLAGANDDIQITTGSVVIVLVWLRLLLLLRYHPTLGSFFIMVVDMIERDVSKFMYVPNTVFLAVIHLTTASMAHGSCVLLYFLQIYLRYYSPWLRACLWIACRTWSGW